MYARGLTLMIAGVAAIVAADAQVDPLRADFEGVWLVSDSTNNNTGDREVEAFQTHLDKVDFVTLKIKCTEGKPVFFVEWTDQTFPDQTVVTIGPSADADSDPTNSQYVFAQTKDDIDRGLRASPETTAKIITAIGEAEYLSVTAYPTSGVRSVGMDITGIQTAWARVSRHCPIRKVAKPPK